MVSAEHQVWASKLASELKAWMKKNGYRQLKTLSEELGINRTAFERIARGVTVSSTENYARIYWRTGILSAYPVTIPKVKSNPEVWTNTRYTTWKFEFEKQRKAKGVEATGEFPPLTDEQFDRFVARAPSVTTNMSEEPQKAREPKTPEIGSLLEQILAIATQQIADAVADRLHSHDGSLADLLSQLDRELDRLFAGTSQDRDAFMREHGAVLGKLFPILETLMAPRAEREQRLLMMRR